MNVGLSCVLRRPIEITRVCGKFKIEVSHNLVSAAIQSGIHNCIIWSRHEPEFLCPEIGSAYHCGGNLRMILTIRRLKRLRRRNHPWPKIKADLDRSPK